MGFPLWTLWGMAVALFGALALLAYSLYMQNPRRARLQPYRTEATVRALTTYALALLLLVIGFFLAGVPLSADSEATPVSQLTATTNSTDPLSTQSAEALLTATPLEEEEADDGGLVVVSVLSPSATSPFDLSPTPFADVASVTSPAVLSTPASTPLSAETSAPAPLPTDLPTVLPSLTPTSTPTPTPTSTPTPTATSTPTPTNTPLPTLTPTPIAEPTGMINTNGSTLWLRRLPGGQNFVLLQDKDIVILQAGNASQSGILWKQVKTVNGIVGWVESQFLLIEQ